MSFGLIMLAQALATAQVNARGWRRVVAKYWLLNTACSALPEPWLTVEDLDLFSRKQFFTRGLGRLGLRPHLEMNEHLVVRLAAIVGLGNHVNAIHCTQVQLFNHGADVFARRVLEYARDADARFAGFWFFFIENVGRVGEKFF